MLKKLFSRVRGRSADYGWQPRGRGHRVMRILIIVAVITLALRMFWGWRTGRQVRQTFEQLRQSGAALVLSELQGPEVPPAEDAWDDYVRLCARIAEEQMGIGPLATHARARGKEITDQQQAIAESYEADRHALERFRQAAAEPQQWSQDLRPRLARRADLLELVTAAGGRPSIQWRLNDDIARPMDLELTGLLQYVPVTTDDGETLYPLQPQALTTLLRLLSAQCLDQYQQGQVEQAVSSLETVLRCVSHAGLSPWAQVQALQDDVMADVALALQIMMADESQALTQTANLRELLKPTDVRPDLRTALAFGQAILCAFYNDAVTDPATFKQRAWLWAFRPFHDQQLVAAVKTIELARKTLDKPMGHIPSQIRELSVGIDRSNIAQAVLLDLRDASHSAVVAEAYRRLTLVALAVYEYRQQHGDLPETLEALCPDYLEALPSDPMTDGSLGFVRQGDAPRIYSAGLDGVDNNGAYDLADDPLGRDGRDLCWFFNGLPAAPDPPAQPAPPAAAPEAAGPNSPN